MSGSAFPSSGSVASSVLPSSGSVASSVLPSSSSVGVPSVHKPREEIRHNKRVRLLERQQGVLKRSRITPVHENSTFETVKNAVNKLLSGYGSSKKQQKRWKLDLDKVWEDAIVSCDSECRRRVRRARRETNYQYASMLYHGFFDTFQNVATALVLDRRRAICLKNTAVQLAHHLCRRKIHVHISEPIGVHPFTHGVVTDFGDRHIMVKILGQNTTVKLDISVHPVRKTSGGPGAITWSAMGRQVSFDDWRFRAILNLGRMLPDTVSDRSVSIIASYI